MGDGEKLLTHLNSALKVLLGLDIFPRVPKKKLNFVDQCYLERFCWGSAAMREATHFHLPPKSGIREAFSLHTHTASNVPTTAHGYSLTSQREVSRETPGQSVWYLRGQWGIHFFSPQNLRFSTVSIIPSLHHDHSSIYHIRYLISENDNVFK